MLNFARSFNIIVLVIENNEEPIMTRLPPGSDETRLPTSHSDTRSNG